MDFYVWNTRSLLAKLEEKDRTIAKLERDAMNREREFKKEVFNMLERLDQKLRKE